METFEVPKFIAPEIFKSIDLSILASTPILVVLLIVFFVVYFLVSIVLVYHWSKYGMKSPGILIAETLYVFISAILFLFAALAIAYY